MNRIDAKKLSEKITNQELKVMLSRAKSGIKDWTRRSSVNKGLTIGATWNFIARSFDEKAQLSSIHKTNLLREFGEYLEEGVYQPLKANRDKLPPPQHQEPIFDACEYIILSLHNTREGDKFFSFWGFNNSGYVYEIAEAGIYKDGGVGKEEFIKDYHNTDRNLAIEVGSEQYLNLSKWADGRGENVKIENTEHNRKVLCVHFKDHRLTRLKTR